MNLKIPQKQLTDLFSLQDFKDDFNTINSAFKQLIVNVKDYGAVGNANYYNTSNNMWYVDSGFTTLAADDTAAFTSASAALVNGGTIFVPSGNYQVQPLTDLNFLKNYFTLQGQGRENTKLRRPNPTYMHVMYCRAEKNAGGITRDCVHDMLFKDITFEGIPNDGNIIIEFNHAYNFTFDNCVFRYSAPKLTTPGDKSTAQWEPSLYINCCANQDNTHRNIVKNCLFDQYDEAIYERTIEIATGGNLPFAQGGGNLFINNCVFENQLNLTDMMAYNAVGKAPLSVTVGTNSTYAASNIMITECKFEPTIWDTAIFVGGERHNITVAENQINVYQAAIWVKGTAVATPNRGITVTGNVTKSLTDGCINIDTCEDITVTGNTCDSGMEGIIIYKCNQFTVTGNTVKNSGYSPESDQTARGFGVRCTSDDVNNISKWGTVSCNTFKNCSKAGVALTGQSDYITVVGNNCLVDTNGTVEPNEIPQPILVSNNVVGAGLTTAYSINCTIKDNSPQQKRYNVNTSGGAGNVTQVDMLDWTSYKVMDIAMFTNTTVANWGIAQVGDIVYLRIWRNAATAPTLTFPVNDMAGKPIKWLNGTPISGATFAANNDEYICAFLYTPSTAYSQTYNFVEISRTKINGH